MRGASDINASFHFDNGQFISSSRGTSYFHQLQCVKVDSTSIHLKIILVKCKIVFERHSLEGFRTYLGNTYTYMSIQVQLTTPATQVTAYSFVLRKAPNSVVVVSRFHN